MITQCFTNGTVILQCGLIQIRHNMCWIRPYTSDTNSEGIYPEKCVTVSKYDHQLYTSIFY